jgi:hypothetical protein
VNRAEVTELLRYRRVLTGELFGEHHVEPWHEVLAVHDYGRIRARLVTLVRSGVTKIEVGHLTAGIKPPERDIPTHSPRGEEYLPWSDPRAQTAFRSGYRESTGREWAGDDPTGAR